MYLEVLKWPVKGDLQNMKAEDDVEGKVIKRTFDNPEFSLLLLIL